MIKIRKEHTHGDMSLCNLASVNLVEYRKASEAGRKQIAKMVVLCLDNAIANGLCPIEEGNVTNNLYRYIGVGVMNAANAMALEGIVIDTQEAAEWFDEVMEDLTYNLYYASMELSKVRGPFRGFEETKWAEGLTPVHLSMKHYPNAWRLTEFGKRFEDEKLQKWNELGNLIKEHGIRNAQVVAIAPTANSGKAVNASESTEPVMGMIFKDEGMFNVTSLAPNLRQNMAYYKPAFECDQKALVTNAIVRQKYIDQAQSITLYFKQANSLKQQTEIHNYGFDNGIKTFYYIKQQKNVESGDDCVACAV